MSTKLSLNERYQLVEWLAEARIPRKTGRKYGESYEAWKKRAEIVIANLLAQPDEVLVNMKASMTICTEDQGTKVP